MASQSITRTQSESLDGKSFLDFPAEIRNQIYQDALVNDAPIELSGRGQFTVEPNLLFTCRQVRNEAIAFYYSCNTFHAKDMDLLERFFEQCTREKLELLRTIRSVSPMDRVTILLAMTHRPGFKEYLGIESAESIKSGQFERRLMGSAAVAMRERVAQLIAYGETYGVLPEAVLLPLDVPDAAGRANTEHWVTLDEHRKYAYEVKDGKVVLVQKVVEEWPFGVTTRQS